MTGHSLASILASPEFEEALARDAEAERAVREEVCRNLGADRLAIVAIAPAWTDRLLAAADLVSGELLETMIANEMLVQSIIPVDVVTEDKPGAAGRSAPSRTEQKRLVVPVQVAQWAVSRAIEAGAHDFAPHLTAIALAAQTTGITIPDVLLRFAALVRRDQTPAGVGQRLLEVVDGAKDPADAVNWIRAAERLELVLGRPLVAARLQAGRLVNRQRRDQTIDGFLTGYFERPEMQEELLRLPDSAGPWLLHLRGDAGMGKSTLLRWFQAQHPSNGSRGSIVVVDFDYLAPTYPTSEPGLLIQILSTDLRLFGTEAHAEQFDALDNLVADWHLRIDEAERTRPAEVPRIRETQIGRVQDAFAEAVSELPQPVVIVLDTLEELEKVGVAGNLTATGAMLSRLHDRVPGVRVVLSGRRSIDLLAGGKEVQVLGLARTEATEFVHFLGVTGTRADAVVERVAKQEGAEATDRLNPFDLSLLAGWASRDPTLTAERIRDADMDGYIEQRLLTRMSDLGEAGIRQIVPVMLALGRFDAATLGGTLGIDDVALQALIPVISRQEWLEQAGDDFAVRPRLHRRLIGYFARRRPLDWAESCAASASYLRQLCLNQPLAAVTAEHAAGAIRLSKDDDPSLPGWWQLLEERARSNGGYGWLLGITQRLLSGDPVGIAHPLWAAISASRLSCQERVEPRPFLDLDQWRQVFAAAPAASFLRWRAAAHLPESIGAGLVEWISSPLVDSRSEEAIAAAFIGGLERLLEKPTAGIAELALDLSTHMRIRVSTGDLLSMGTALSGRAAAFLGRVKEANSLLTQALAATTADSSTDRSNYWMDWPVADPKARARSLVALTRWRMLEEPADLAYASVSPYPQPGNEDHRREQALRDVLALAIGLKDDTAAGTTDSLPAELPAEVPICWVHRVIPPPVVPFAFQLARRGEVTSATSLLETTRQALLSRALDSVIGSPDLLAVERAMMVLARQFRLRDIGLALSSLLFDSDQDDDAMLLADLDALSAAPTNLNRVSSELGSASNDAARWHQAWRQLRYTDVDSSITDLISGTRILHPDRIDPSSQAAELHRALDLLEFDRMQSQGPSNPAGLTEDCARWLSQQPRDPEAALRVACRCVALLGDRRFDEQTWRATDRLGRLLSAEVLLNEAEALALRLPSTSLPMFASAAGQFSDLGEPVGELRALTSHALAALASGRPLLPDAVDRLRKTYSKVAQRQGLPPWTLFGPDQGQFARSPRHWLPWVVRVGVIGRGGAPFDTKMSRLIGVLAASSANLDMALPADIALALADRPDHEPSSIGSTPPDGPPSLSSARPTDGRFEGLIQFTVDAPDTGRSTLGASWNLWADGTKELAIRSVERGVVANVSTDPVVPLTKLRPRPDHDAPVPLSELARPVEISHDAEISGISWEAAVLPGVRYGRLQPPPRIWRRVLGAPLMLPGDRSHLPVFAFGRSHELTMELSGVPLIRIGSSSDGPTGDCRALLFTGLVRPARDGLRLTMDSKSKSLISAAELAAKSGVPDLVVLAGEPDDSRSQLRSQREQSFNMRSVGGQFAQLGAAAVLCLPPVPSRCLIDVGAELRGVLDVSTPLRANAVLDAVHRIRFLVDIDFDLEDDAFGIALFLSESLTRR